jgi:hypothetical protein
MIYLWFCCSACGADNHIPAPEESHTLTREKILPKCRCRSCGHIGASDMRRYYKIVPSSTDGSGKK